MVLQADGYSAVLGPFSVAGGVPFHVEATDAFGNRSRSATSTLTVLPC